MTSTCSEKVIFSSMMTPRSLDRARSHPSCMRTHHAWWRDLANVMVLHLPTLRSKEFLSQFSYSPGIHWQEKQLHVISVEEYTDAIENLRYSVDKPDEAKWAQMTSRWNIRCHLDIFIETASRILIFWIIPATCILRARYPQKNPYKWNKPDSSPQLNSARKMHPLIGSL
jgi:hypothetical protein